jgi:L-amino acid N-acyltransferase YncA
MVTDDDMADVDDAAGIGGIVITGLSSSKRGDASKLLEQLVDLFPASNMAVVAYAASGDHERLYKLYSKFGFEQQGRIPSLRVRY